MSLVSLRYTRELTLQNQIAVLGKIKHWARGEPSILFLAYKFEALQAPHLSQVIGFVRQYSSASLRLSPCNYRPNQPIFLQINEGLSSNRNTQNWFSPQPANLSHSFFLLCTKNTRVKTRTLNEKRRHTRSRQNMTPKPKEEKLLLQANLKLKQRRKAKILRKPWKTLAQRRKFRDVRFFFSYEEFEPVENAYPILTTNTWQTHFLWNYSVCKFWS